jgi:acylglycerol lipase
MNNMKILKKILYGFLFLVIGIAALGLVLAYLPVKPKTNYTGITPEQAAHQRAHFKGPHAEFKTTDGATLFLRRWNPDSIALHKKDIAVLIFHGITGHSGFYFIAGEPLSAAGYTTFGLDYRGHGLSDGNRGDSPGKDRWIADLAESITYVKSLGFSRVIILGHSLGVAAAICAANAAPREVSGVVLLSGAYEGKKGVTTPPTLFETTRLLASSVFRPSYQAFEYYRKGMVMANDSLFNYRYTPRFLMMLDVKKLRLQNPKDVPVLVGVGDRDELFDVDKVRELYDLIPGSHKEFLVMKNTTHAKIPRESWEEVVTWLDRNF